MEDRLKKNENPSGFHFPEQYEVMSVEMAFHYLELAKEGHGMLFVPDNIKGFMALLVLKCRVDIDYVFSDSFVLDIDEIKKHILESQISTYEFKVEVAKRIIALEKKEERESVIYNAKRRYDELNILKRFLLALKGQKRPNGDFLERLSTDEISDLYKTNKAK